MRSVLRTALLLGPISIAIACDAFPELVFEEGGTSEGTDGGREDARASGGNDSGTTVPDAASGGSSGGGESSSGGSSGGTSSSGSSSGGSSSSSGGGTDAGICASGPPPGATACCDGIPCVGKKCAQRCGDCKICKSTQTCCIPNGGAQEATCAADVGGC